MLSGRYRTDRLVRFFSADNKEGLCTICPGESRGTIEHILVECSTMSETRQKLYMSFLDKDDVSDEAKTIIQSTFDKGTNNIVQLLLDCSVIPEVISLIQMNGPELLNDLFRFSRAWCFSIHMKRLKILGQWKNSFKT